MSVTSIFRLGLRVAEWATPHVQKWHRAKHLNRTEGQRHLEARNYSEAEKYLTIALSEKHSQKHRAHILAQLAKVQTKQSKLASAEESARAALSLGNDSSSQWEAVEILADIQAAQGNAAAAIETLEAMEGVERSSSKPELQRLAKASRQRGKLLLGSGRSADGLAALGQAVKLAEQAWGPDHIEVAHTLSEIGALHNHMGNHKEGQRLLGQALRIYKVTSGYHSEEASRGLHNLALSLEASGDFDAAATEYERFVAASQRQIGGDAVSIANAKIRLGALYAQGGRSAAARELLTPVIATLENKPNEALRDALQVMAAAEDQAGHAQDAARWREKASRLSVA